MAGIYAGRNTSFSTILQTGTRRLENTQHAEIEEALRQIARIAKFRLDERVAGRSTDNRRRESYD